jgi:hypothetical protein
MEKRTRRPLVVAAVVAAAVAVVFVVIGLVQTGDEGALNLLAVLPGVFVAVWYAQRHPGRCHGPWPRRRER